MTTDPDSRTDAPDREPDREEKNCRIVLERNATAFASGDVEAILANYADNAIVIRPQQIYRGKHAIRSMFQEVLGNFAGLAPQAAITTVAGRVALMTWSAASASGRIVQGVDTFVVEDDHIVAQTYVGSI